MKINNAYEDNGALFYTVELEKDVFVDVKCIGDLCYVMDCEDGYEVYDSNGNTFDYHYNKYEVINFVIETMNQNKR